MQNIVIAIDGPSGVGKSTLGKEVARRLDYLYIDSGAVYRAVGLKAIESGIALEDHPSITETARQSDIRLEGDPHNLKIFLDGRDVTREIRTPDASRASSVVATIPEVREVVVDKLRAMADTSNVVMDGRDVGTKIFPRAQVKVFLEASNDVRARRRWQEDVERGRNVTIAEISDELEERDRRDRERAATPLAPAEDAILIDTSELSVKDVIERVLEIVNSRS